MNVPVFKYPYGDQRFEYIDVALYGGGRMLVCVVDENTCIDFKLIVALVHEMNTPVRTMRRENARELLKSKLQLLNMSPETYKMAGIDVNKVSEIVNQWLTDQ